jgi:hypothetical protein
LKNSEDLKCLMMIINGIVINARIMSELLSRWTCIKHHLFLLLT